MDGSRGHVPAADPRRLACRARCPAGVGGPGTRPCGLRPSRGSRPRVDRRRLARVVRGHAARARGGRRTPLRHRPDPVVRRGRGQLSSRSSPAPGVGPGVPRPSSARDEIGRKVDPVWRHGPCRDLQISVARAVITAAGGRDDRPARGHPGLLGRPQDEWREHGSHLVKPGCPDAPARGRLVRLLNPPETRHKSSNPKRPARQPRFLRAS